MTPADRSDDVRRADGTDDTPPRTRARDVVIAVTIAVFVVASLGYMAVVVRSAERGRFVLAVEVVTWMASTFAVAYVAWGRTRWGRD